MKLTDSKEKKLGLSIVLNLFITIAQLIGGFVSGSLSLISDALHNFSDVISLIVSFIASRLTKRPFTPEKTYGWKRAEIIAALFNSAILIVFAVNLIWEGFSRLISEDKQFIDTNYVIALAALSILINGFSVLLLRRDAKDNMNIESSYLHLLSDMFTSVAVLAGGFAMYLYGIFWIDSALSIAIAIYLIYISLKLLLNTLRVIMHFTPAHIDLKSIESDICAMEEIENIHHVHIWQLDDKEIHFAAHLDLQSDLKISDANKIKKKVNRLLKDKYQIHHTVLQQEYGVEHKKETVIDER
jgi:cobalt-zinc-cadmium efflux system protein